MRCCFILGHQTIIVTAAIITAILTAISVVKVGSTSATR
jgi:hypothetical protein